MRIKQIVFIMTVVLCNISLGQQVTSIEAFSKACQFANRSNQTIHNSITTDSLDAIPVYNKQDFVSPGKNDDLFSTQYYTKSNTRFWAKSLAVISGVSFIAGTSFVSWSRGYDYNKSHYSSDGEGPVDLTASFNTAVGLLFYAISIGTAIPSIMLFKKDGEKTESAAELSLNGSQLLANGYQCDLGVYPGGLKIIVKL